MRVICTQLPVPIDGMSLESSPWVTLHSEYTVVSMLAESGGRVRLHDDAHEWCAPCGAESPAAARIMGHRRRGDKMVGAGR